MTRYKTLVVGTKDSIKSARATELMNLLSSNHEEYKCMTDANSYQHADFDLVFIIATGQDKAGINDWVQKVRAGEITSRFLVLYDREIRDEWREILDPEIEIGEDHALAESIDYLFEEDQLPSDGSLSLRPDSNVGNPINIDVFESHDEMDLQGLSDESSDQGLVFGVDSASESSSEGEFSFESEAEGAVFDLGDSASLPDQEPGAFNFESEAAESGLFKDHLPSVSDEDGGDDVLQFKEASSSIDKSESEDNFGLSIEDEEFAAPNVDFDANDDSAANSDGTLVFDSKIKHPDSDIRKPLAGRETFAAELLDEPLVPADDNHFDSELDRSLESVARVASMVDPNLAHSLKSEDLSTIQKYAAIKEREAREKEATIRVLKGQMAKFEAKIKNSAQERRRLSVENSELKNQVTTLDEDLSQKKFHIQKMDGLHQEEMRALSLRLDNAIFQASKSQNKLEEFRDRVRTDLVKIRAQERELFNKLELQKRDAEALLASKDEQLLDQRREIDRLHYELEGLRERMVEETEKAEDRSARLKRATQSLKLANDLLSGLGEEVLPSASDRDVAFSGFDKGDDAA